MLRETRMKRTYSRRRASMRKNAACNLGGKGDELIASIAEAVAEEAQGDDSVLFETVANVIDGFDEDILDLVTLALSSCFGIEVID